MPAARAVISAQERRRRALAGLVRTAQDRAAIRTTRLAPPAWAPAGPSRPRLRWLAHGSLFLLGGGLLVAAMCVGVARLLARAPAPGYRSEAAAPAMDHGSPAHSDF